MKLLLLLLGVLLVSNTWAKPKDAANEDENEVVEEEDQEEEEIEEALEEEKGYKDVPSKDPCYDHNCPSGTECDLDEKNKPICVCAHHCTEETDDRAKVCSTTNTTFESECELHRQKCLCQKHQEGCKNREYRLAQMDYFGPCIEIKPCTDVEMLDFPIRMRDWLFLIMEELAKRKELPKPALRMARRAGKQPKRWVLPVIWKFCDLDQTHDLNVDSVELTPITAPLKPMEHCTGPFLEKCDANNDGHINLREWSACLGLDDEDKKEDLDALCSQLLED